MLTPNELGIPVQVICLPWIYRSRLLANRLDKTLPADQIDASIEDNLAGLFDGFLSRVDPSLPVIVVAHAMVSGATAGDEKDLNLGSDFILSASILKDPRIDYVALGHIHKAQNLNGPGPEPEDKRESLQPPVVYSGSIERVNFGEIAEKKYFITAKVERGKTSIKWNELTGIRPFIKRSIVVQDLNDVTAQIINQLPSQEKLKNAVVHINIEYPVDAEKFINETEIRAYGSIAFDFRLTKTARKQSRSRIAQNENVANLTNFELLDIYLDSQKFESIDHNKLVAMANSIFSQEPGTID
jgi:exonuclease SbcD